MGTTFVWNEKYTVNVALMDQHHKKLFALIDQLHGALRRRQGREIIQDVLEALFDYTKYHFSEEEALMEKCNVNGLSAHKYLHQQFINTLSGYREKVENGMGAFITANVMKTLNDWLVSHIGKMDKLYGEAMNAHGIH